MFAIFPWTPQAAPLDVCSFFPVVETRRKKNSREIRPRGVCYHITRCGILSPVRVVYYLTRYKSTVGDTQKTGTICRHEPTCQLIQQVDAAAGPAPHVATLIPLTRCRYKVSRI